MDDNVKENYFNQEGFFVEDHYWHYAPDICKEQSVCRLLNRAYLS